MSSITPSTINSVTGSDYFQDHSEVIVNYLDGPDSSSPARISGISTPCKFTISIVDMRTYHNSTWIIMGTIIASEDDTTYKDVMNTNQAFYYPRDSFLLPS